MNVVPDLETDVVIAGAGPAGTSVAARLRQRAPGLRVLVLERYRFPREKPCGGGLTGHVEEAMAALGFTLDVPHVPSQDARVRFGSFERRVTMGRPVHIIRREQFDASLVAQVRARGVEIVESEGVKQFSVTRDAVLVRTSRGRTIRAAVLVGADGVASVVRKHILGNPPQAKRPQKRPGNTPHRLFKMEMTVPGQAPDPAMLYDFTPMSYGLRGYLWVFPVPGNLINVGVMHYPAYRQGGPALIDILRRGLADLGIELPERGTRGWPVWGYQPSNAVSRPRVLLVGDAAGIDGLTGEGIAVAMEHAIVAADAVIQAFEASQSGQPDESGQRGEPDAFSFRGYRKMLRRAVVGRELALDRWLARLLYGGKGERWRFWLSLVLFDPEVLELYAARVSGTQILADRKSRLYSALARHALLGRKRRKTLQSACPDVE